MTELVAQRRTARSAGLSSFVDEVQRTIARSLDDGQLLAQLRPAFARLLGDRRFLDQELAESDPSQDEVLLHHDALDFVVLARGVATQQRGRSHAAVPHDHGRLWALYGLYSGNARLRRYEADAESADPDFPGLRKCAEVIATEGGIDAIPPHQLHLPVFAPEGRNVIVVVYREPLGRVQRRGYVASRRGLVSFQGAYPPADA